MNVERAIEVLEWWVTSARAAAGNEEKVHPRSSAYAQLKAREDQTRRVLAHALGERTLPSLLEASMYDEGYYVGGGIERVNYALGRLRTDAETRAILGSEAPSMSADALHPLIWDAASKHWEVGHYSAAVQRAATMLNVEVQDRAGRTDTSDSDLMKQTFSLDAPQPGKPRLRWPGDDADLNVRSMRTGILNLAQAVFSAIRNPATHKVNDIGEQEALEQLATLSLLARWIENCELVSA